MGSQERAKETPLALSGALHFLALAMTGIRTHGKPPRKPRLAPGHLEKYSLEAGRSVIEVASDVIALLVCPLKW
jgi:hypothetical protein